MDWFSARAPLFSPSLSLSRFSFLFFSFPFFSKRRVCVCACCARFIDRGECTVNVPTNDESRSKHSLSLSLSLSLACSFEQGRALSRAQHGRCFVTLWELNLRETALTSFRARARNPDERLSRENAKLASDAFFSACVSLRTIRVHSRRECRSGKLVEGASTAFCGSAEAARKAESRRARLGRSLSAELAWEDLRLAGSSSSSHPRAVTPNRDRETRIAGDCY